ncbi:hypothetical protein D3C80_2099550 [compost metagenome]
MHTIHFLLLEQRRQLASVSQQLNGCRRSAEVDSVSAAAADALIQRDNADIDPFLTEPVSKCSFFRQDHQRLNLFTDIG